MKWSDSSEGNREGEGVGVYSLPFLLLSVIHVAQSTLLNRRRYLRRKYQFGVY